MHGNRLGSTTFLTDHTGATTQKTIYYPWGQMWASAGTVKDERFASLEQRDAETGNDPTLFRMYQPRLYRWMSPDPVAGDITNPQSLNRYAYVLNNPTNFIDPPGLQGNCDPSSGHPPANPRDCIPFDSYAQQNLVDPGGWSARTWGMQALASQTQVLVGFQDTQVGWLVEADMPVVDRQPVYQPVVIFPDLDYRSPGNPGGLTPWVPPFKVQVEAAKKGFYYNPIDQALNPFHGGEWSFRQIFRNTCSTHLTVNKETGKETTHTDTINPVPGYAALIPPATLSIWGANATLHYIWDVRGFYPSSDACN